MCLQRSAKFSLAFLIVSVATLGARAAAPDLILRNGRIFTGDPAKSWVEAVSILGDKVLALGSDTAISATADKHTRVLDLHGRMAMPGINDAHEHAGGAPYGVEAVTKRPPQADPSIGEVAEAVRAAVPTAPADEWIHLVAGASVLREVKSTRAAIEQVAAGHPVILEAWWGHGVILNTQGLARLGIDDSVQDPPGGHYDRDESGHLSGRLEEYASNAVKQRLGSQPGVPASVTELRAYADRRLREGVTSVQIMATNQRLSALKQTMVQAHVPLRLRIMRFPIPAEDALAGEPMSTGEEQLTPLVRVAGVKWVLDGTPIDQLAYSTRDYASRTGWRGRSNFSIEFIDAQLKRALEGKDQFMLHIVGDAMTDEVLAEMQKLAPAERWQPLRVRFEHGDGLTTPARMNLAHQLGIVIAQPRPGRPFRALVDAGIPLAYGSDQGMAPFFMLARMTAPGDPNAITRLQALSILTQGSAYAEFEEKKKGTLAPGMFADIAVLSQDVMAAPPDKLPETHSLLTMIGGRIAYSSPELATEK